MRKRPEAPAAAYCAGLAIDGDDATAGGWRARHDVPLLMNADIGCSCLVERQVPHGDGSRPVSDHAVGPLRPARPGGHWVGKASSGLTRFALWTALGEVGALLRKGIMHLRHGRRFAGVAMPRNAIDELVGPRIAQFGNGASPESEVVVQHPDFGGNARVAEERSQVFAYEEDFVFLRPLAGRITAIDSCIDLVLDGDRVDPHALRFVGFEELLEIARVWLEIALADGSPPHCAGEQMGRA